MQIHGFNKTTLLDYPGIVACTVFTGGCNFRCPFCQNADLVLDPNSQPLIDENEVFAHLKKRSGIVKGICITGGEPTLQKDLPDFIKRVKAFSVKVKLDTNGSDPEILKYLIEQDLLDYVAMDIKAPLEDYKKVCGVKFDETKIKESVSLLLRGNVSYEFRTTVVKELHNEESFKSIGELIKGASQYFLQGYVDSERVISRGFTSYSKEELEKFVCVLEGKVNNVKIRGVD